MDVVRDSAALPVANREASAASLRDAAATAWRIAAEVALSAGLAAAICAAAITQSLKVGRLSVPPMYDDVVYLTSASRWIAELDPHSLGTAIRSLFDQHAPVATWFGILGLQTTAPSLVGPYAWQALPLAAYLFGIATILRELPLALAGAFLVAVASAPFLSHAATEFRPDLVHGALAGLCAVLLLWRPFAYRRCAALVGLGALAGFALLAKPSASLATMALLGAALAMRLALDARERPARLPAFIAQTAWAGTWFCLAVLVVAGPTFAMRYAQILAYVHQTLVTGRDFWAFDGSVSEHLRFYVTGGGGGGLALGPALWIALATFPVRLIAARRNRADLWPLTATAALVAIAYAIPTIPVVKTYFLGAAFYGTLVTAAVVNLVVAARAVTWPSSLARAKVPLLVAAAVLAAGWGIHRFYRRPIPLATTLPPDVAANYRAATQRIWALVRERAAARRAAGAGPLGVTFNSPDPANPSAIELYAVGEALPVRLGALFFERQIEGAVAQLPRWDIVVVASSIPHQLPGPRMGDELMAVLDARNDFALVDSFQQETRGVVRVYERRRP